MFWRFFWNRSSKFYYVTYYEKNWLICFTLYLVALCFYSPVNVGFDLIVEVKFSTLNNESMMDIKPTRNKNRPTMDKWTILFSTADLTLFQLLFNQFSSKLCCRAVCCRRDLIFSLPSFPRWILNCYIELNKYLQIKNLKILYKFKPWIQIHSYYLIKNFVSIN